MEEISVSMDCKNADTAMNQNWKCMARLRQHFQKQYHPLNPQRNMKDPLHDVEVIERYFDNALTSEEREEFSRRLRADRDFHDLFEQERTLIAAIRFQGLRSDLGYLKELENSWTLPGLR
jgi:hypothetical protein